MVVLLRVFVQVLCSYSTLPLYAIVTQVHLKVIDIINIDSCSSSSSYLTHVLVIFAWRWAPVSRRQYSTNTFKPDLLNGQTKSKIEQDQEEQLTTALIKVLQLTDHLLPGYKCQTPCVPAILRLNSMLTALLPWPPNDLHNFRLSSSVKYFHTINRA